MKAIVFVTFLLCLCCAHADPVNVAAKRFSCEQVCPPPPSYLKCKLGCSETVSLECANAEFGSIADAELDKWEKFFSHCRVKFSWTVRLGSNLIERLTPIPRQGNATILDLKGNKIKEIEPKVFISLPALTEIDLSHNQLTGEAVRADVFIGQWVREEYEPLQVQVLRLSQNNIHSLSDNTFEHLPKLRELHLHDNPLKVLDEHTATAITSLPALEWLSLSNSGLRTVSFPAKSPLRKLYLNNNAIKEVPKELPAGLRYLNLNGNPIPNWEAGAFSSLSKLEELSISGMPNLTAIGDEAFRGLSSLHTLLCDHNSLLREISPKAFDAMGANWTLKEVSLEWASLTNLPRDLLQWRRVESLDVRGNPWDCDTSNWSPEAIDVIRKTERAQGFLEDQQSCRSWRIFESQPGSAPRRTPPFSTAARTLMIAVSASVVMVSAMALLVLTVRMAQTQRNSGAGLMVHYRRTHVLLGNSL